MKLLELPDDVFHDIFRCLDEEWYEERPKTLTALRLSCKRLQYLIDPQFFSSLRINIQKSPQDNIISIAASAGLFVRDLFLNLYVDPEKPDSEETFDLALELEKKDKFLATLLTHLTNIHEITIHAISDTAVDFPLFVSGLGNTSGLKHFKLVEIVSSSPTSVRRSISPFSDKVVQTVLTSSGSTLQTLTVDGLSVMSPETFQIIRSNATNLRMILFRSFLGRECTNLICEPVEWACRNTLKVLVFYHCGGAHAGGVACGIGNGLWATSLRWLEVVKSGQHDDSPNSPYPFQSRVPLLKKARYEHSDGWEMDQLSMLGVKEVTLAFIPRSKSIQLVEKGSDAFKGLQVLNVVKIKEEERDDTEIERVCMKRGVLLNKNAEPVMACTCGHRE